MYILTIMIYIYFYYFRFAITGSNIFISFEITDIVYLCFRLGLQLLDISHLYHKTPGLREMALFKDIKYRICFKAYAFG